MPRERQLDMPIPRWQKPATKFYENNYSFGMNFYQPMIDWLDEKDRGGRAPRDLPHLPWLNERGLKRYDPSQQSIKTYGPERVRQLAVEAQLRAQEDLRESRPIFTPRSQFSLAKQVEVANSLTRKVLGESIEERHAEKRLKERQLADLRRRTQEVLDEFVPSTMSLSENNVNIYKARSRRAIANDLMMESVRHLQDSRTEQEIRRAYTDSRRTVRSYLTPYWRRPQRLAPRPEVLVPPQGRNFLSNACGLDLVQSERKICSSGNIAPDVTLFLEDGSVEVNPYLGKPPRAVAGDIMTGSLQALKECKTEAQVRHALRTARKDINHYFHPREDDEDDKKYQALINRRLQFTRFRANP